MFEYRVVWQREEWPEKTKIYQTKRGAQRWLELFGDEPWKASRNDPDDFIHCSGKSDPEGLPIFMGGDCECGGETYRERAIRRSEEFPPTEYAMIEVREVGEWHEMEVKPNDTSSDAAQIPHEDGTESSDIGRNPD